MIPVLPVTETTLNVYNEESNSKEGKFLHTMKKPVHDNSTVKGF